MPVEEGEAYLKYALFCRDTTEGPGDELALDGIIDLIELPAPQASQTADSAVLAEVDVNLVFCIGGATPGPHHLLVAIKAPGGWSAETRYSNSILVTFRQPPQPPCS